MVLRVGEEGSMLSQTPQVVHQNWQSLTVLNSRKGYAIPKLCRVLKRAAVPTN